MSSVSPSQLWRRAGTGPAPPPCCRGLMTPVLMEGQAAVTRHPELGGSSWGQIPAETLSAFLRVNLLWVRVALGRPPPPPPPAPGSPLPCRGTVPPTAQFPFLARSVVRGQCGQETRGPAAPLMAPQLWLWGREEEGWGGKGRGGSGRRRKGLWGEADQASLEATLCRSPPPPLSCQGFWEG